MNKYANQFFNFRVKKVSAQDMSLLHKSLFALWKSFFLHLDRHDTVKHITAMKYSAVSLSNSTPFKLIMLYLVHLLSI